MKIRAGVKSAVWGAVVGAVAWKQRTEFGMRIVPWIASGVILAGESMFSVAFGASAYYSNPEVLWRSGTTWSMHVYKMDWTPDDRSYPIASVTGSDGWTPLGAADNKLLWQRPWWTGHFPEMTIWTMNPDATWTGSEAKFPTYIPVNPPGRTVAIASATAFDPTRGVGLNRDSWSYVIFDTLNARPGAPYGTTDLWDVGFDFSPVYVAPWQVAIPFQVCGGPDNCYMPSPVAMGQAKDGRLWIAWRSNAPSDDYFELDEYPQPFNTFSPISPSRRIGGSLWYDLPWNGNWDVGGIGASSECSAGGPVSVVDYVLFGDGNNHGKLVPIDANGNLLYSSARDVTPLANVPSGSFWTASFAGAPPQPAGSICPSTLF